MNSSAMRTSPDGGQLSSFKSGVQSPGYKRKTQEKKGGSSFYFLLILFIALVIIGIGIYFAMDNDSVLTGAQNISGTGSLETLSKIRDISNQTVPNGVTKSSLTKASKGSTTKTSKSGQLLLVGNAKLSGVPTGSARSKSKKITIRKSNKGKTSNSLLSPGRGQKIFKVKRKQR